MQYNNSNIINFRKIIEQEKAVNPNFVKNFVEVVYAILTKRGVIKKSSINASDYLLDYYGDDFLNLPVSELRKLVKDVLYLNCFNRFEVCELTTIQLNELTCSLLELDKSKDNDILDFCSGGGTFITTVLNSGITENLQKRIYGYEINKDNAYIAKLVSEIFGNNYTEVEILNRDIFIESSENRFDKARIFPPLGIGNILRNNQHTATIFKDVYFKNIANSEWMFIDKVLQNMKENFRAVALVLGKNLWDDKTSLYRKHIVESGYLEGIIELPTKVLPNTSAQLYLLVLSNGNKEVKFLDASSLTIKNKARFSERERVVTLDVGSISDAYFDCKHVKSIETVIELKNLVPSLVNQKRKEIKNGIRLGDIAEVFTGNQYTLKNFRDMISDDDTGYSILRSNDIDDYIINLNELIHIDYKDTKFDKYCIQYGDVIVTSKSSKVKVGVVDFVPKEKIIVTGGMIIVRPKKDKLNSTYLKVFLDSKLGNQSLKEIIKGSAVFTINSKDLSEIKIPAVDLAKQEAIAVRYERKVSSLIALRNESKEIESQLVSIFDEIEED